MFDGNVLLVSDFRKRILALKFSNKKASEHHKTKQAQREELIIKNAKTMQTYLDHEYLVKDDAVIILRRPKEFTSRLALQTTNRKPTVGVYSKAHY